MGRTSSRRCAQLLQSVLDIHDCGDGVELQGRCRALVYVSFIYETVRYLALQNEEPVD